jgi:hypothetical protein
MDERQLRQMGELAATLYEADPEVKAVLDKASETIYPGIHAKVTAQKSVDAAKAVIDAKVLEFDLKLEAEKAARVRDRAVEAIKANPDLRIRDDEVPEVEKLMLEHGIGKYEDGAYRYRRQNQVAAPARSRASTWEVPGLGEDGLTGGLDWMKGIIGQNGVNLSLLDKRAKRQKDTILADYEKDPVAAESRWGSTVRWGA